MSEFLLVAAILVLLSFAFVLFPLMMNRSAVTSSRRGINVDMFKQRLQELESELALEVLDEVEFQQLKMELQRHLLEDTAEAGNANAGKRLSKPAMGSLLMLALTIPLLSFSVYQQTGAKADWDITETLRETRFNAAAGQDVTVAVTQLMEQVSARLEQRPNHDQYLVLLGRTQMQLKNYPAASDAFQRLAALWPDDPSLLGQYAQALYLASGRQLTPKVLEIADRALAIDSQQTTILGMLGIGSFEQGDYQAAINYWQQLLPSLGPVSPNRRIIQKGIDQAKTLLLEEGGSLASVTPEPVDRPPASLSLEVALSEKITADPNAVVFIYARAVAGPRMPLAIVKLKVSDLPASVILDDSMAMAAGMSLSGFEQVEVVARISKKGIANPGSGDIEGIVGPIVVAEIDAPITVLIDRLVP